MISFNTLHKIAQELAIEMIREVPTRRAYHVSFIIAGKSIIGIGTNSDKSHPIIAELYPSYSILHSEVAAYAKINKYLRQDDKLILVNFRFNKQLAIRLAKPCKYCMAWCYEAFNEIYYTTNDSMKLMRLK